MEDGSGEYGLGRMSQVICGWRRDGWVNDVSCSVGGEDLGAFTQVNVLSK